MKSWQINRKVGNLTRELDGSAKSETRIDINCLTEPERMLFERVQEIIDKYAPASPPKDVIEKNADLWYKGLEIFGRRATELFVDVVPASFCCDELEEWYFKIYFHNFMLDWLEQVEQLREMPKEQHDTLFCERREMGLLDRVFRLNLKTTARLFERSRKIAVSTSKNPRLGGITFHTLRHWKATMEYHKTKDILHVMRLLGHKNIKNTMRYTQLVDFGEQDYVVKVAWTLEEACKLLEGGFQYVCDYDKGKIFRKLK